MCRMWHAVAMRDPALVRAVSGDGRSEASAGCCLSSWRARRRRWRRSGRRRNARRRGGPSGPAERRGRRRGDGIIRGGADDHRPGERVRPKLTREMMVVMRSNALIGNITRKLAKDGAECGGEDGNLRKRAAARRRRGGDVGETFFSSFSSPHPPRARGAVLFQRPFLAGARRWGSARGVRRRGRRAADGPAQTVVDGPRFVPRRRPAEGADGRGDLRGGVRSSGRRRGRRGNCEPRACGRGYGRSGPCSTA